MAERSILVTGASGVLGWNLCRFLEDRTGWRVTGTYRRSRPQFRSVQVRELDLLYAGSFDSVLEEAAPDCVVHAAAITLPDDCDRDRERACAVNVTATRRLLDRLPETCRFLYISTDLVFDGEKGSYTEQDEANPVNYYGETKLEAERCVLERSGSVVLRIAKLFSHGSPFHACFTNWIRDHLAEGRPVRLFTDQFRTPVSVFDVARAVVRIADAETLSPLYHFGGPERLSRYEFGLAYALAFGFDPDPIVPAEMAELGMVPRGRDCSRDSTRIARELGCVPHSLEKGFAELKKWDSA